VGHKSGLKTAGARGLAKQLSRAELEAPMHEGHELDVADKARGYEDAALDVMVKAVKRRGKDKAPWAVAVNAAKTIIEIGSGRAATREAKNTGDGGLTILVNQLVIQSGQPHEIEIPAEQIKRDLADVSDAEWEPTPGTVTVDTSK
jgi:hypothetical protein